MPQAHHASHAFERLDDLAEPLLLEDAAGGDLTTDALGFRAGAAMSCFSRAAR